MATPLEIFLKNTGLRDFFFNDLLSSFNEQAINICQIGAIEKIHPNFRKFSGWSDVFFGRYIAEYGRSLTICDIRKKHLDNSTYVLTHFYPLKSKSKCFNYRLISGEEHLSHNHNYDLIYLDGSNCPNETLKQFNQIDLSNSLVVIDDFKIKGTTISFDHLNATVEIFDIANGIAVIDAREN